MRLLHPFLVTAGGAVILFLTACQTSPRPSDSATMEVSPEFPNGRPFFDDFTAAALDESIWEIGVWWEHGGQTGRERTYLRDGRLHMALVNDPEEGILSSALQTRESFLFGRWEASLKPSAVPGVLNSFYTIDWNGGDGSRQEIDIEFLTYTFAEDRGEVHLAVHARDRRSWSVDIPLNFNPADDFHVWGFEITPEHIQWFVDDTILHTYVYADNPVAIDRPYQLKFNVWTQEAWIHGPPEEGVESVYEIEWIRFTPAPRPSSSTTRQGT